MVWSLANINITKCVAFLLIMVYVSITRSAPFLWSIADICIIIDTVWDYWVVSSFFVLFLLLFLFFYSQHEHN